MFRNLDAAKLSSKAQKAEIFFYPGAHASLMQKKLESDSKFRAVGHSNVGKIFILTGSNNIDSIYYGSRNLTDAIQDISTLLDYIKNSFPNSSVQVINILPRDVKGRNDIINEINLRIKQLCDIDESMNFIDTETEHHLFSNIVFRQKVRKTDFFNFGDDNVHLNNHGIIRLGRHLKYLAHKYY